MVFRTSPLFPEVIVIEPEIHRDQRGSFTEIYHEEKFKAAGIRGRFVQDNRSHSRRGTLRGLHYQVSRPQGKLVWALSGEIYDVVVDIRIQSPTFMKWFGLILSEENMLGLYIPPNFAHGYSVLSNEADFFYKCTDFYAPSLERSIRWNDPELGIDWPVQNPIVSEKDARAPLFKDAELPS